MTLLKKIDDALWLIDKGVNLYPNIGVACSFGKDSMVILDLCRRVRPDIPVFALLADTEFVETNEFARHLVSLWNLNYQELIYYQEEHVKVRPEICCKDIKVEAAKEAVKDLDAWIAGVRVDESPDRRNVLPVDNITGLIRINPILEFTETDIWRYLAIHQIPVNPIYQNGYRSLGCKFCSTPESDIHDTERSGRWNGTAVEGGECGIHVEKLKEYTA